jgi:prepilin-type N-terminal cleavage/methylation domain-containing protein
MRCRKGFTIIELMIAVAIIGILAVVSTTNMMSWRNHSSAVGLQREILAMVNDARTRAMASNRKHRMIIYMLTGNDIASLQKEGTDENGLTVWEGITGVPTVRIKREPGVFGDDIQVRVREIVNETNSPVTVSPPAIYYFIFNPGGQVLSQVNAGTPQPLGQARIRLTADNPADLAAIRLFGWTSQARLENDAP